LHKLITTEVYINIIVVINSMDTTICIKQETKKLFLDKKREICAVMKKDLTADEFLRQILLGV